MQADNQFDLEKAISTPITYDNDLFVGGGNQTFNATTAPNSKWWDGTDSGLSIRNISGLLADGTMAFEIGRRPPGELVFQYDNTDFKDQPSVKLGSGQSYSLGVAAYGARAAVEPLWELVGNCLN